MRTARAAALGVVVALLVWASSPLAAASPGVVNINTAAEEQLVLLPRVGPSLARRIVEFRESNGRFKAAEDLILVQGIGEKTFQLIEPYVTVEGETTLKEKIRSQTATEGR